MQICGLLPKGVRRKLFYSKQHKNEKSLFNKFGSVSLFLTSVNDIQRCKCLILRWSNERKWPRTNADTNHQNAIKRYEWRIKFEKSIFFLIRQRKSHVWLLICAEYQYNSHFKKKKPLIYVSTGMTNAILLVIRSWENDGSH